MAFGGSWRLPNARCPLPIAHIAHGLNHGLYGQYGYYGQYGHWAIWAKQKFVAGKWTNR